MRILLLILLAISNPVFGADNDSLVGTWKLVSWQVILENGPPQDVFGAHPKGFLILIARRAKHGADDCREAPTRNGRSRTSCLTQVNARLYRQIPRRRT